MSRKPMPPPSLIIGVDPSQRHNGIAVFDVSTGSMKTSEFGFVEDVGACELLNEAAELAKRDGCHVLALIECPTWPGRGTKEVRSAALVWERAIHRLFPLRTVRRVDPREWQRQLLGAAKGDTKGQALRYARLGLKITGIDSDHQADAACICEYARLMASGLVSALGEAMKESETTITLSTGGTSRTVTDDQLRRAASGDVPRTEFGSRLRGVIGGKLLKAIVKCFAARPYKGNEKTRAAPQAHGGGRRADIASSIGVAPESFVATNGRSAIVIGKRAEAYDATQRNEALLEAERALIYETTVELDDIARMVDASGEIEPYHVDVGAVVGQLAEFRSVGHMRPEVLKTIAAVAEAAGAASVELLEPRSPDQDRLGFRFSFQPDAYQFVLGDDPPDLPILAEGLVVVTRKLRDEDGQVEADDDPV